MEAGKNGRFYFDLRCLQDPDYQFRGVGHHVAALLRARRRYAPSIEIVGLTDDTFEPLPAEYVALVDRVSLSWNPSFPERVTYVSASPMTHDPALAVRFQSHPRVLSASVVYDFIPLDRDGYFPAVSHRIDYFAKLAFLKNCDVFLPISEYSAKRLHEVVGSDRRSVCVTGASVRESLYSEAREKPNAPSRQSGASYFLTVGGGDRRKNTEVAVRAVWLLRTQTKKPIRLKIVGRYGPDYAADLIRLATEGGSENFLDFCTGVSDAALVNLYAGAVATIAPSHIEGFSLPVVEAAVCANPVIASTCAAHLELIHDHAALFPSSEPDVLCRRLEAVYDDPQLRHRLICEQQGLAAKYHEDQVGRRFWEFLALYEARHSPMLLASAKPKVAFLTPYPPQASGVSRFSEATLHAARERMDIDLYTDAPRPLSLPPGVTDAGPINSALLRRAPYDSVISVIGNSDFHLGPFELMERYGGPCILHDSRLTHIYHARMGRERFSVWAQKLLKRSVTNEEIDTWLHDQDPPSLFIETILERADPLIVHTGRFRDLIRERYARDVRVATFPPNMSFTSDELSREFRSASRNRLGIPDDVFAVATFGYVAGIKGIASMVIAIEMLRSWRIPADLYFVGSDLTLGDADRLAADYGVKQYVHTHRDFLALQTYRDYMLAVDAAIQLRLYDFGQPSAALADCVSAGLPAVANESLAESCDAPDYVTRVHNHVSPLIVAEQLREIYDTRRRNDPLLLQQREAYLAEHNFAKYSERLLQALELA